MRRALALAAVVACAAALAPAPRADGQSPFEGASAPAPVNRIDELVFARLKSLGLQPAPLCSDAVFLRRVYLDVIGTLPTVDEARAFLDDHDTDKRRALIERLLARDEFADYWAMKWGDTLRLKSEFPINLWPNAVQAYHRWIRSSLRDNVPYDRFARELLTESGSNFRVAPVNFYRAVQSREPRAIASAVALTFMGARAGAWPKARIDGMAGFFAKIGYKPTTEWKEEIVYFDPEKAQPPDAAGPPVFPDGMPGRVAAGQDPREAFASWLIAPSNPWFAQSVVNRVWFWLLGRGLVHEADDIRPDNPPSHPDVLAYLERELVAAKWDLKAVYRLILNSATYQLSSIPRASGPAAETHFAHALVRPLDAEVVVDAIDQITGTSEQFTSAIPEPYTFVPPEVRSIAVGDGSITSAFLETLGRPPRDTGLASERSTRPTASERLYLLNGADVQRKLQQGPKLQALLQGGAGGGRVVADLYLAILSRYPTDEELKIVGAYAAGAANRRQAALDVAWALVNSVEFRYRH